MVKNDDERNPGELLMEAEAKGWGDTSSLLGMGRIKND
jgi:hypothetical protein